MIKIYYVCLGGSVCLCQLLAEQIWSKSKSALDLHKTNANETKGNSIENLKTFVNKISNSKPARISNP